ncbi:MAG: AAA family ATPase, partial [Pseudomonadota bacterium]
MAKRKRDSKLPAPFLQRLTLRSDTVLGPGYPFDLPWLAQLDVTFTAPVTILVGENGAGKSTLIEAIAKLAGFGAMGGAKGYTDDEAAGGALLEPLLSAAWLPRITQGWFLRAETFHAIAPMLAGAYLDQSHGQGFLQLFADRCQQQGLYLLDEPESALSPRRQLVLARLLTEIGQTARAQVIMAT